MANDLFGAAYNPDVLSCLANLSNDEVFTPPEVVNQMLDLLPQELFSNPDITFLDPTCKTGVFLHEITKRLIRAWNFRFPAFRKDWTIFFKRSFKALLLPNSPVCSPGVVCIAANTQTANFLSRTFLSQVH